MVRNKTVHHLLFPQLFVSPTVSVPQAARPQLPSRPPPLPPGHGRSVSPLLQASFEPCLAHSRVSSSILPTHESHPSSKM
uniref:Uncharacterized protein n=1 Tax=Triticum urartu TaxID=4572 RepID=A0A8R7P0V2_TRIUA